MSDDTRVLLSLDATEITAALVYPGSLWRAVRVVAQTGSTNADLLAAAGAGAAEGAVLVAEAQTAGRGRLDRRWASPPRAGLTFSVLLRPGGVPAALLGWLPLLAGVAAAATVRRVTAVDAVLKWPNDVLAGDAKLGGILAERTGTAVVIGIGINVWQGQADLPPDAAATSLALAAADGAGLAGPGGPGLRARLLTDLLDGLSRWYLAWRDQASPGDADACGLRREYLRRCATLGRPVTVTMPGAEPVTGTAAGVDETGRLEVRTAAGLVPLTAGHVTHVRPANDPGH
jgi:BirA family transcriptional regulator, biotin operon repressor / biotin---[acetyl-CoA-carboxylase] ligase